MSKNIETVLQILKDEVNGDVSSALQKMASDYSMTWMYRSESELFPKKQKILSLSSGKLFILLKAGDTRLSILQKEKMLSWLNL